MAERPAVEQEIPSGRDRRRARTRQAILEAARAMVVEEGPDNLSLREVARRVDYSAAALYEYFSSKEELTNALAHEAFHLLAEYLGSAPAGHSPREHAVELGLAYLRWAREHSQHFILVFTRLSAPPMTWDFFCMQEGAFKYVIEGVRAVHPDKSTEDVQEIAYGYWALVHGMAMLEQTALRHVQGDVTPMQGRVIDKHVGGF